MYDTLLDRLVKLKIFISAYADDIVLGIIGKKTIVKILKVLKKWAEDYEMKFNQEKTKIIFHKKETKDIKTYKNMEVVKNTKMLGTFLDKSLNN